MSKGKGLEGKGSGRSEQRRSDKWRSDKIANQPIKSGGGGQIPGALEKL